MRRHVGLLLRHLVAFGAVGLAAGCAGDQVDERFVGVYCYASLAAPSCYTRPLAPDYDRLLGYSGPAPRPLPDRLLGEAVPMPPQPAVTAAGPQPDSEVPQPLELHP